MKNKNLPKSYMGYSTEELLKVREEIAAGGTKADKRKIKAMRQLIRDHRLFLFEKLKPQATNPI